MNAIVSLLILIRLGSYDPAKQFNKNFGSTFVKVGKQDKRYDVRYPCIFWDHDQFLATLLKDIQMLVWEIF